MVEESGERTVVGFRDWQSSFGVYCGLTVDALAFEARHQLEGLVGQHQCTALAIDMSPVGYLPSSLLGVFIGLFKGGVQVELLHPSPSIRESLEVTKLDRFFTVRVRPALRSPRKAADGLPGPASDQWRMGQRRVLGFPGFSSGLSGCFLRAARYSAAYARRRGCGDI